MPESDFSKLNPSSGIDRIGAVDDRGTISPSVNVRHDNTLNLPLRLHIDGPGILPAPPPAPVTPAPPPPSEAQRRAELRIALDTQKTTQAVLVAAEATHARASAYAAQCRETLESFGSLDADLKADLLVQLRAGGEVGSSGELRQRAAGRQQAELDYVTAAAAAHECANELTQATAEAQAADTAVSKAVAEVAALHAVALAEQHVTLLRQAQGLLQSLHAFDFWTTRRIPLPGIVVQQLRESGINLAVRPDQGAWIALGERLLADPGAPLVE